MSQELAFSRYTQFRYAQFTAWRKNRPFWAGLFLLLGAIALLLPSVTHFSIGDITLTISNNSGIKIILLTTVLWICGIIMWINPAYRVPAGVIGMIIGVLSLQSANFGGFGIGLICSVIGSAWGLSWYNNIDKADNEHTDNGKSDNSESTHQKDELLSSQTHYAIDNAHNITTSSHDIYDNTSRSTHINTTPHREFTTTNISHEPTVENSIDKNSIDKKGSAINPTNGIRIFIALLLIVSLHLYSPPTLHAHATPSYRLTRDDAMWMILSDHIQVGSVTIDGVGIRPSGDRYLSLTVSRLDMKNFGLTFPYGRAYRGNVITRPNSTTLGLPFPDGTEKILLRSLRADFSFNGKPLGRWIIDTNGIPMQLLTLLGLPRFSLPQRIIGLISLDNVQIETFYYQTGTFILPGATVNAI